MQQHSTQQSNAESRPRPAQNLADNLPELGELIPVDSFFNRYVNMLGVGRQSGPPGQGSDNPATGMQPQTSDYQQGQPSFRYPTTANYLAQLTGHDLQKQSNQVRSSLPVEQLDTSMQHRHMNGHGLSSVTSAASGQPDMLAYPASSLAHFQQLLQAQAGNPNGVAPPQADPRSQGIHQSAALQAAQQAIHIVGPHQQQWFAPKAAASLTPPADSINQASRDPNRPPTLSPTRYGSSRHAPGHNASSPQSWAKPQQSPKGSRPMGNGAAANGADGSDMEDEGQSTGSRMPSGTLSRTNRTPRQQLQNKQAQQRYRERRKMKVTEMEQALAAMSQQVEELQGVLKQNVALQSKTLRLEEMLTERDAKVEQLSVQLKSANAMAAQPSAPNQESAARDSGAGEEDGRPQPASAFDGMSDLKLEFQGQIMKLQQYIEANNLRHVDPLGASVPKEVLQNVTDMVQEGCRVCRRVQAEGLQVLNLITRDPNSITQLASTQEKEKWSAAVRAVRLTPLQVEQVLIWREEHLKNVSAVYQQRQQLNTEVSGRLPDEEGVATKRLEAMQIDGYLLTAKANLELGDCLEKIKENLRWEQRTVLQFNWVLVNRIMSPIQTALFMVHAWPSHCDCLALVNAINAMKSDLLASGPGSSGSPSSQHSTPQGDTQGGLAEPMQTDASPAERSSGLTNTHAAAAQPASSSAAASEAMSKAMSNGHGQSQAQMAPAAQQVLPFASAFRPVLPTRRDSNGNISRGSLPSGNPSSAFQPVGRTQRAGGSIGAMQSQPSASSTLPEVTQSAAESADSPQSAAAAAAARQVRQQSPTQQAQPVTQS